MPPTRRKLLRTLLVLGASATLAPLAPLEARAAGAAPAPATGARARSCGGCGRPLASARFAIEVDGRHVHRKVNPQGRVFVFAVFSKAPGVVAVTAPTLAHTWFDGFAWSALLCGACQRHQGWRWSKGTRTFYGLIEDAPPPAPGDGNA